MVETNSQQENNLAPNVNRKDLKLTTISSAPNGKNKAVPSLHHAPNLNSIIYILGDA